MQQVLLLRASAHHRPEEQLHQGGDGDPEEHPEPAGHVHQDLRNSPFKVPFVLCSLKMYTFGWVFQPTHASPLAEVDVNKRDVLLQRIVGGPALQARTVEGLVSDRP